MVYGILNLKNSNICNQYDGSTTNFYHDFKLNSPSYYSVNSEQDNSNNIKVYHQNIRGLKGKISQLSNILHSELPHSMYN